MNGNLALQTMRQGLHLSSSQMNQYLLCSKKYQYHYVCGIKPEHVSINLLFGSAIHAALEAFYKHMQKEGEPLPVREVQKHFLDYIASEIAASSVPVKYTKELPDLFAVEAMGKAMLEVFCDAVDLTGYAIEGVELPLSAPLYDEQGDETGFDLVGIIDLLLREEETGRYIAIDHKTSKNAYSASVCQDSHQMSLYAYLLQENGYLTPDEDFTGWFNVLRKLKTPKFELAPVTRTPQQIETFLELARGVLTAIDREVYLPNYSWACADCGYRKLCRGS